MGIDYIINHTCEAKEHFGIEGLMERLKSSDRAKAIIQLLHEEGKEVDPPTVELAQYVNSSSEETTLQSLLDHAAELKPYEEKCHSCPASFLKAPFGCYGYIQYPISADSEEWLMSLLLEGLKSGPGQMTYGMMLGRCSGTVVADLRKELGIYFASAEPVQYKIGDTIVSSDQLLHMMFFVAEFPPVQGLLINIILGLLPGNITRDILGRLLKNPSTISEFAKTPEMPSPEAFEFFEFLMATQKAASLNSDLVINP